MYYFFPCFFAPTQPTYLLNFDLFEIPVWWLNWLKKKAKKKLCYFVNIASTSISSASSIWVKLVQPDHSTFSIKFLSNDIIIILIFIRIKIRDMDPRAQECHDVYFRSTVFVKRYGTGQNRTLMLHIIIILSWLNDSVTVTVMPTKPQQKPGKTWKTKTKMAKSQN